MVFVSLIPQLIWPPNRAALVDTGARGMHTNDHETKRSPNTFLDSEPLMALDKFIEQTGLSPVTIWRFRKKKFLETVNICGRHYVLRSEIARFNSRALAGEFDENQGRRNLQIEATAHVRVQSEIDCRGAEERLPFTFGNSLGAAICYRSRLSNIPPSIFQLATPAMATQLSCSAAVFSSHRER